MSMKIAGLGAAILANSVLADQEFSSNYSEFSFFNPVEVDPTSKRIDIDSANRTFID